MLEDLACVYLERTRDLISHFSFARFSPPYLPPKKEQAEESETWSKGKTGLSDVGINQYGSTSF